MIDSAEIARRPTLVVHDLAQARVALRAAREAGRAAALWSPPGAAAYWGAAYFAELAAQARAAEPGADAVFVLDCGAEAGAVMAALRCRVTALCFTGPEEARARLADMAVQAGAALLADRPPAVDLGHEDDPSAAARESLGARR